MDKKAITESLRALASDNKNRSKAARLRDVIDEVEAALAAGVHRASVVEELAKHGLEMTLATFETTLKRIRQKRTKSQNEATKPANHTDRPSQLSPVLSMRETENACGGSHNPADLDKIIGNKPDLAALAKLAKRKKT